MIIVAVNLLMIQTLMPHKIIAEVLLHWLLATLIHRASDGAAKTALHHPAPSWQSELQLDEIRAPLLSREQHRLLQDLKDLVLFVVMDIYVKYCLSAAHIAHNFKRRKNETEQQVHSQVTSLFQVQGRKKKRL